MKPHASQLLITPIHCKTSVRSDTGTHDEWTLLVRCPRKSRVPLFVLAVTIWLTGAMASTLLAQDLDPELLGEWPPHPPGKPHRVVVEDGLAYCALAYGGLAIIDISNPSKPQPIGGIKVGWDPIAVGFSGVTDVAVFGNYAFIANNGLYVIDVSNPAAPKHAGHLPSNNPLDSERNGYAVAITVTGGHAYVLGDGALKVIDISDPAKPSVIGHRYTSGAANELVVAGTHAFVAAGHAGLEVFEVSNPANPVRVSGYATEGHAAGVSLSGQYAYVTSVTTNSQGVLEVIDITNPANPRQVGRHESTGTTDEYGVSSQVIVVDSYAYIGDLSAGLEVLDVTNPGDIQRIGSYPTRGSANHLTVSGDYAYIADSDFGLQVIDLNDPANPKRVGGHPTLSYDALALAGSNAYVVAGGSMQVIDVSTPANPKHVGAYYGAHLQASHLVVSGSHAYLVDEESGLEVIDISSPASPQKIGGIESRGAAAVAVADNYAYVVGGLWDKTTQNWVDCGLTIIDISDPANPQRVGGFETDDMVGPIGTVAVSGQHAYMLAGWEEGTAWRYGLHILNIGEKSIPALAARISAGQGGGFGRRGLVLSGNHALFGGGYGGLAMVDVSVPANPTIVSSPNLSDFVRAVGISGNHAFLGTGIDYESPPPALVILDVSSPSQPIEVGRLPTYGNVQDLVISNGLCYLVEKAGLKIINVTRPAHPQRVGRYVNSNGSAWQVSASGELLFVVNAHPNDGFDAISIRDPINPVKVGSSLTAPVSAADVTVSDGYAYAPDSLPGGDELKVFDIRNPAQPALVGRCAPGVGRHTRVAVTGNLAFVGGDAGLRVINISDRSNPSPAGRLAGGLNATLIAASDEHVYVTDWFGNLHVVNVTDPANPRRVAGLDNDWTARHWRWDYDIALSGHYLYVLSGFLPDRGRLRVIDINNPANPHEVGSYTTHMTWVAKGLEVSGRYAYLASYWTGLEVLDVSNPANVRRVGGNSAFRPWDVAVQGDHVYAADGDGGLTILNSVRPLRLTVSPPGPGHPLTVTVCGPLGSRAGVQRSTNLRDWQDWMVVSVGEQPTEILDPEAPIVPQRFYRVEPKP
jgi:hypothetical protein